MESKTLTFEMEKETKNTVRFSEMVAEGSEPVSVFESGAILLYLAEKVGRFMPASLHGRKTVLEWLMWQMGGLGPMAGQNHHFVQYAPEQIPYAISRYVNETNRLYGVLDTLSLIHI